MPGAAPHILVIFDVDGTLLLNRRAVRDVFLQAFLEITGADGNRAKPQFAGMTDRGIFRTMLEEAGVTGDFESLYTDWEQRFTDLLEFSYATHPDPYLLPGVMELVEDLAGRPEIGLALGTGNTRRSCAIKLARFGLDRYFPVGGFGGDYENRVDLIRAAMREGKRHYGWSGEAWVIGDTDKDVEAARGAGAKVIAVNTGIVDSAELIEAKPDAILDDLTDRRAFLRILGIKE
ncbi:MAG: HAD hydrolase-like protein [bacterium]